MKKNMSIREMWHYIIFQTKGYRTIKAAIILGVLTAAAVPYVNSIFYADILDCLVLANYDTAVIFVVWMVAVTLVLKLSARAVKGSCITIISPVRTRLRRELRRRRFPWNTR